MYLEQRCRERGYSLEEVLPCVVLQDGDEWTINVSHEAYPAYPRERLPSLLARISNFATAAAQHVAAGAPMASDEEIARRHAICVGCEFYDGKACIKCGCPVKRERAYLSKLSWADQSCPVGKWGPALKG